VIEHVPADTGVTLAPLTVQIAAEFETKLTVRPELAEALSENAAAGSVTAPGAANVTVWEPCETVNVRVSAGAAA
jgi:hypothetical protein